MKKFGLKSASSIRTPISPNVKLIVDLLGKSVDSSPYRSMISSLFYFTASRPDSNYNVGVCARYQANPKESHMIALKRIIKYVKTTTNFGVWYSKDTNDIFLGIMTLIGLGILMIERVHRGVVSIWVIILSPG